MVEISEVVTLKYRDGPPIALPKGLINEDQFGGKWLRLRPSNFSVAKLVLGHMDQFKTLSNPSLANSPQLKIIWKKVKGKLKEDGDAPNPFGEECEEQEDAKGKQKDILANAPATVLIELNGAYVTVRTPKNWKESDLIIPLKVDSLNAVFDFIMEDTHPLFNKGKRPYNKSGQYANKARKVSEED